jgi:ARG and Rhodanese-Phosphatase-superfamily-associated Protein domain
MSEFQLSGPCTHENLTIFLIQGEDKLKGKKFLTLQEALEQKKVVVHETGNVNQLTIENLSPNEEIFIQSGEIVKGGRQDRLLSIDLIVPSKSGQVPISSFCVEHGRWVKRGNEAAAYFAQCPDIVASNGLRLASKYKNAQGEVWKEVTEVQGKLSMNAAAPVQASESASSLQLTLEHKKVQESIEGYVKKLADLPKDKKDAIGYVMAINGKMVCADVYASRELFLKLWPKMAKACAVEAFSELQKDKKFPPATVEAAQAFLADSEKGKAKNDDINKRVRLTTVDSKDNVLFETFDNSAPSAALHRNYLKK